MKIALIQQHASRDKEDNVARGLASLETAARAGAALACYAELAFEWFHPQRPASGDVRGLAEPIDGPTVSAFQRKARELGIVTVINLFERDGDRTFDSSPVIDADGTLLDFDIREVQAQRAIIEHARRVVLVADSSKFARSAPVRVAHLDDVDILVTDRLPTAAAELCRAHGVEVVEAGGPVEAEDE